MGRQAPLLATHEVLSRAVLAVGYYNFRAELAVRLVLVDQVQQLMIFGDAAGCSLHGGNHSMLIIDRAMMMVTRAGALAAAAHERCVRIGGADHPIIDRLVRFGRAGVLQFALLRLISALNRRNQFRAAL